MSKIYLHDDHDPIIPDYELRSKGLTREQWEGQMDYRRIYGHNGMFSCQIKRYSIQKGTNYFEFGKWFIANCVGEWSYPDPETVKFTHEEDLVKFVLLCPQSFPVGRGEVEFA